MKKFIIAVKIFHAVNNFSHHEIKFHAVKIFHPVKKLLSLEKICSYRGNILLFHFIKINHSLIIPTMQISEI